MQDEIRGRVIKATPTGGSQFVNKIKSADGEIHYKTSREDFSKKDVVLRDGNITERIDS